MDSMLSLLGRNGFLPHGYCFTWTPGLLWSMVGADTVIAAAYFSIPIAILSYVRKRPESATNWLALLFSAFIFSCGITHVMDIWTIWQPDYALQALTKLITAAISLVTAVALWPLIPRALKIPSVRQLNTVIGTLEAEIEKRRAAENQVASMQQSLAVALSSIDAAFITAHRDGRVSGMNALAETITGWTAVEALDVDVRRVLDLRLVSESTQDSAPLLSMTLISTLLENVVAADGVQRGICVSRTGIRTALEIRGALTRDVDGGVSGLAVVFRDMSRLDKAETDSKRLAAIVESSNDAIISEALDGRITTWNTGAQKVFGYTAEEAIGRQTLMLYPSGYEPEQRLVLSSIQDGDLIEPFDTVRVRKDGKKIDVSVTISPLTDASGKLIGASKIARDVTERRRNEEALRESEDLFRKAFHQSPVGTVIVRASDGICTDCNDTFVTLAGCAREQLVGHTAEAWALTLLDEGVEPSRAIPSGGPDRAERTWMTGTGEVRHALVSSQTVLLHGETHHVVCAVDITDRKRMEESLRSATTSAELANLAKSRFLANMSHEIRTPMHAVIALTRTLSETALDTEQSSLLDNVRVASKSLMTVINDVLDLSKIEAGELRLEHAPFSLSRLLSELGSLMAVHAQAKRIGFNVDVDGAVPEYVLGDAARLQQVLTNLLFNAIKFTEQGEVRLVVEALGLQANVFSLKFAVHDSGVGIAPDVQPKLFAPFVQADTSTTRHHGGSGLGLSIVKRLVELSGGTLGMQSSLGEGSEFWVVMDFERSNLDAMPVAAEEPWVAGRALAGVRVLVVDDSDINLAVARRMLELEGAQVVLAEDGQKAVDALRAHCDGFDVVLMDVQMPVLDGYAATRCIRNDLGLKQMPVIALTAGALSSQRAEAASAGMSDFISKPFDAGTMVRSIRRQLSARSSAVEGRAVTAPPVALTSDASPRSVRAQTAATEAEAASPWPMIEGIDTSEVQSRLGGDSVLFQSLLKRLFDEFSSSSYASVLSNTPAFLALKMHKLRGIAGMLGASKVADLATRIEHAVRKGEKTRAVELEISLAVALRTLQSNFESHAAPEGSKFSAPEDDKLLVKACTVELIRLLRAQGLSARSHFRAISSPLRSLVGEQRFQALEGLVESLKYREAADLLEAFCGRAISESMPES